MIYILPLILILFIILIWIIIKKNKVKQFIIITILLIAITYFIIYRHEILFNIQSIQYNYLNDYDYKSDLDNYGYLTEDGALAIAKENSNSPKISKVTCKFVKPSSQNFSNIDVDNIKDIIVKDNNCYWEVSFTSGFDRSCYHDKMWHYTINYYTGEIISVKTTD